jgi:hypothetical protein
VKQVRFLAYLKTLTGVSTYKLLSDPKTVKDAIVEIAERFPQISDLIIDEIPEVSFILGDKTLVTPSDLNLPMNEELIIGPIVAGG